MNKRESGILLHVTSLPSPYGIGDLGPSAFRFADFLSEAGQSLWQILPLTPTLGYSGHSPYDSSSSFAGNKLLISPESLCREGLLRGEEIGTPPPFPAETVDYESVVPYKEKLLDLAYERFKSRGEKADYERFLAENAHWLEDFSLFTALKAHFQDRPWSEWPRGIRDRETGYSERLGEALREAADKERFIQYTFFRQWFSLKEECNRKGISIFGDLPIYVACDSADVWSHPEIFKLRVDKKPAFVAGVPPDYFSRSGQLWGNPVYDWDLLRETGFEWWLGRLEHNFRLFDLLRIDHFRGFVAYWEVPSGEKTAIGGKWVEAPGDDFFSALLRRFPRPPIIAEDLGSITPDVVDLIQRFGFPGMKVLLFAFGAGDSRNPYLPHNYRANYVVYTGTHDNNTVRGWFENRATEEEKSRVFRYLGREVPAHGIHDELIRLAMMSAADRAVIPMQDLLGLGEEARMNRPGTIGGNFRWRLAPEKISTPLVRKLSEWTEIYGRAR
jgi:4-alpha-glucanotransferase